jgi:hypothetical protein
MAERELTKTARETLAKSALTKPSQAVALDLLENCMVSILEGAVVLERQGKRLVLVTFDIDTATVNVIECQVKASCSMDLVV